MGVSKDNRNPGRGAQRARKGKLPRAGSARDTFKSERVYQELRRQIRQLELWPGTKLRKGEIARACATSLAPVNEAIARLAEEGLIEVVPQSGSFVTPIRLDDVREHMLIRAGLEIEASRRVTEAPDRKLLARLERNLRAQALAVRRQDMVRLDTLDAAFHRVIMQCLAAPRAQRLLEATRAMLDRSRFHALPDAGRPQDTLAEHRRIVEAIRNGEVERAGAAMRAHLEMVTQAMERGLARMGSDPRNLATRNLATRPRRAAGRSSA